jgi:multiple sugar transport system ATP-binding protein
MPAIDLVNVSKRWGKFVGVDHLNLHINDREFITLLGPSGCGKTTTLRMIAGLETPTEGKITIGDTVVFDSETGINVSPAKRDIGFLFQNYALWPHMTVYKNIAFGLENLKWKKPEIEARVDEVMKMLKIEQFKDHYPSELSGGQQQRVAIARTLATKPKVLFMDEPLSNLDAKLRGEMRTELKRLHKDTDSTFVYVTHDQLEAMTLATRICLINQGVLQQCDPPLTVYNNPANLFVADFVGNPTMNFIPGKAKIVSPTSAEVTFFGFKVLFESKKKLELSGEDIVLGIRPEFLPIRPNGKLEGLAYSTLPTGMETTVKIDLDGDILSAVVFGSIDYETDSKINFDIVGDGIILFDAKTKKNVGLGSVKLLSDSVEKAKNSKKK